MATKQRADIFLNIRAERARRRLRLSDVARSVGVTPAHLGRLERNPFSMRIGHLLAIAKALDVPASCLLPDAPSPRSGSKRSSKVA